MKIKPINNFVLLDLKMKDVAENGMIIEDEITGDGSIVPCVVLDADKNFELKKGTLVYVPYYALHLIKKDIYACDYKSIVAYEGK